jgi:hypothetical protein
MSPLTESTRLTLAKTPGTGLDTDAQAYIAAVEAADGATLEAGVKWNIDQFVRGCKADGIWTAIKASCILSGARTLSGALVPLVGTPPTNNNFVSGDYNRKTGLVGNGSTKYLDTNRNNNADPQNSNHNVVYVSTAQIGALGNYIGTASGNGSNNIGQNIATIEAYVRSRSLTGSVVAGSALGFLGQARASSAAFTFRTNTVSTTFNVASETPLAASIYIFNRNLANYANARLAFYSIGEALDLALLDTRISTLITSNALVIP